MTTIEALLRINRGEKGLEKYVTKRRAFWEGFFFSMNPWAGRAQLRRIKSLMSTPEEISAAAWKCTCESFNEAVENFEK